jgi:hypothetical protein
MQTLRGMLEQLLADRSQLPRQQLPHPLRPLLTPSRRAHPNHMRLTC